MSELPFQRHSQTSLDAAKSAQPSAATLRGQVLQFLRLRMARGATDEEIQEGLALNPSTQRPRRVELVLMGLVYDSGLTRPTKSGRKATVWRADEVCE